MISEKNIKENPPKYIIVNAGNANACTGYEGELDIKKYCQKISELTNIKENLICPLSTGVIFIYQILSLFLYVSYYCKL